MVHSSSRTERVRYQLFLSKDLSDRFEELAGRPGASKSSILAAALAALLERKSASQAEQLFATPLDRISNQLARLERNSEIGLKSLALFIRYMLTVNAPVGEGDQAARANGRDRFSAFVVRVGQQLASGRRTFDPEEAA